MPRPDTRQVEQVDDFFGTAVADPYRWLEDTDDPEVVAWPQAQAAYTREHLDALPGRARDPRALDRAVRLPHSGRPVHRGGRWFRTSNDGAQQQDILLVSDGPFGAGRVLIDPNLLGGDRVDSRRGYPARTARWSRIPTARRAATGAIGGCATSRPATTWPTTCGGPSSLAEVAG